MSHISVVKKGLLMASILLTVLFNQPTQARASADLIIDRGHHDRHEEHRRYTEVVVGSDRYYYDSGVFYRGNPGSYVVVEAPDGAVIETIPSGYEQVNIDGVIYFRFGNVYYRRHGGRGYEVVHINRSHERRDDHRGDGDRRFDHR
jgi:Family of unknown function (DUF6515)